MMQSLYQALSQPKRHSCVLDSLLGLAVGLSLALAVTASRAAVIGPVMGNEVA